MKSSNTEGKLGFRSLFPYFSLLVPLWFPMLGAFLCGIIYGISSGFGLPYMVDQIFPKIFSGDNVKAPELSFYQLAFYVAWLPAVFLIRGLSGYFNSYLININFSFNLSFTIIRTSYNQFNTFTYRS